MNPQEIRRVLDKITYKSDYTFELFSDEEPFVIHVRATLKNSRESSEHKYVTMMLAVGFGQDTTEKQLLFEIMTIVATIEIHEALELFRYDDKIIFDPHQFLGDPLRPVPDWGFDPESIEL